MQYSFRVRSLCKVACLACVACTKALINSHSLSCHFPKKTPSIFVLLVRVCCYVFGFVSMSFEEKQAFNEFAASRHIKSFSLHTNNINTTKASYSHQTLTATAFTSGGMQQICPQVEEGHRCLLYATD